MSDDLAALCTRAARRLAAAERPLLEHHGLSMWEYIVLSRLADGPVATQLALAREVGYDKTRLIAVLDKLESAGLLARPRDAGDRRARSVALTAAGARLHRTAQRSIRAMESDALTALDEADRRQLRRGLALLAGGS